jgi:hypothetical protein
VKHILLILLSALPLPAQLSWESKVLEFKPLVGERSIDAKYKFQNVGSVPVTILNIQTSCGCTTVTTAKKIYAPGERGEVEVKFLFGGRRGPQLKTVIVQTDDPKEPAAVLLLRANILELVKVRPSYVHWKRGADKTPQVFNLKTTASVPVKVVAVRSNSTQILTELRPGGPGEYELIVTPVDTATSSLATLTIQTDYPAGKPESFKAYAQVK